MDLLIPGFYGLFMGYVGLLSPGMLNMTALKTSLESGKLAGVRFAIGAACIVFVQAGIALFFADYLLKNPDIIEALKIIAIFVFFGLGIMFFLLSRKKGPMKAKQAKGNFMLKGILMSSINMLGVPFYLGMSVYLASVGRIVIEHPYIMPFVIGAATGSFLLFYTYILLANYLVKRIGFIAQNINLILCGLFFLLGIFTLIKILP